MRFITASLVFLLFVAVPAFSIEEGIVRLDQKVVSQRILESSPDSVPISSVLECLDYYKDKLPKVWAIDLTDTYMPLDDFKIFIDKIRPQTSNLKVLVLETVHLNEMIWRTSLFPLLANENFQFLNIYGTLYDNKRVRSALELGTSLYPAEWLSLSKKIIFASQTYYSTLKKTGQWARDCEEKAFLDRDWDRSHREYYATYGNKTKNVNALKILTGDSDAEEDICEDLEALDLSDGSFNTDSADDIKADEW
jgi:hypothetical protein